MNGVKFGVIHSYNDLNLILAPFTPTPAEPKVNFLEIPGRDGYLDLTEANGEVKYNSREFVFTFTAAPGDPLTFDERVSAVSNALNGLRCKITLDRDPDYYWEGRCAVSEYAQDKTIGQIEVTATVNPYKLKQEPTVIYSMTSENSLLWDGDTTGLTFAGGYDIGGWHVSDVVPTADDFAKGGKFVWVWDGESHEIPFNANTIKRTGDAADFCDVIVADNGLIMIIVFLGMAIMIAPEDNMEVGDFVLPKKGIYLPGNQSGSTYISELTFCNNVGFDVSSPSTTVYLTNGRKSVVPTMECFGDVTVDFNGVSTTLEAGIHEPPDLQLKQGNYKFTLSGNGAVLIAYQEGEL